MSMTEEARLAGFEPAGETSIVGREAGAASLVAREELEVKAAVYLARQYPRDEAAAFTKLMRACRRPRFAQEARYQFKRGNSIVSGPSVDLAREIARCWGNIRYGLRIVSVDAETVHIRGYAYDLETNAYVEHEDKFAKLIYRKQGGWVVPDERELRELINRRGAILVRNAILQVVPSDVVDAAEEEVKRTMVKAAKGEIEQDREAAIRSVAVAFSEFGVTTDMLADYLGHPLDAITPDELADLRAIYKSIRDGNSRVAEHFDLNAGRGIPSESTEELNAVLRHEASAGGPETANGPEPAKEDTAHSAARRGKDAKVGDQATLI